MSARSKIEWTDRTWNPVTGCTKVSPGCDNCYAERFAERFRGVPGHPFEQGFDVLLHPDRLQQPLSWRKPSRVFVNSMSDLFHRDVPDEFIDKVFCAMANAPQHLFQILTKRPERMRRVVRQIYDDRYTAVLRNVWLGVSIESNDYAWRADMLRETPAAVRFLSLEPLLAPVDKVSLDAINWAIVGGESGPGARPMHPAWARDVRDRCGAAGVAFFFKQWGAFVPRGRVLDDEPLPVDNGRTIIVDVAGGTRGVAAGSLTNRLCELSDGSHSEVMERARTKQDAGRVLDGRTHDEFPSAASGIVAA